MNAEEHPTLYGYSDTVQKELTSVKEVAEFIYTEGLKGDVLITTSDGTPFISTFGIFLNRIADMDYGFDGTYYPEGMETVPRRFAIVQANKRMVESVDWLIAYVRHGASNSCKILEYAQRRGLPCVNINDLMEETQ